MVPGTGPGTNAGTSICQYCGTGMVPAFYQYFGAGTTGTLAGTFYYFQVLSRFVGSTRQDRRTGTTHNT